MFLQQWVSNLQSSLQVDLLAFLPELFLCVGIILMLLLRLFNRFRNLHMGVIALALTLTALGYSYGLQWKSEINLVQVYFSGLFAFDKLTVFLRLFLYGVTALLIWLTILTGIPDREDSADFYTLLLGATIGMVLMASANHLLMVFIGVEMASLPSYALAGFLKGRRQSSEAALKYVVYGGGASGIMLYGISLLVGKFGTGYLPDLATGYAAVLSGTGGKATLDLVLVLGTLFILIGIGFKLSAFPFHFWCPDVFEGASAEVAGFLSVASKGAALALLGRFALALGGLASGIPDYAVWLKMAQYIGGGLAIFAALTATFGNLAAYPQTNLKRLLAYSTIAHAGYMLMGLATFTKEGLGAVLFYLVAYLFMNLGAFAVVAFLRNQTGSEDLSSYRGMIHRSPLMTVAFGFFLFSLLGVPPLAGFAAKFGIFRVLFDAGRLYSQNAPGLSTTMYALLVIGGLNTVFSVFYYIKVLKVMILEQPADAVEGQPLRVSLPSTIYACLMALAVLVLGIGFNRLAEASEVGTDRFRKAVPARPKAPARGGNEDPEALKAKMDMNRGRR